ncbi:hypothetical protein HPB47_014692 [Ixodes persulcatus]|uniref:Uncharacterized protein n=1 Tax=Ixodes persulcatus TaxID=34615 RepID=A0AC60QVC7_IXOPE|nr:hypothetical protein HPB47_014692 [Ixodes persulcatus]
MLMVSVLHNIAVNTYLSRPPAQSRGIVRPRFEAETAEVVEGISSETPIQRTEVFAHGHTVKLHFDGPRPPHVDLWGLRLPVSAAYPRPLQCRACGRLGHTRRACRDRNRCPYFCGRHPGNTCRSSTARCPKCGGGHDAVDRWCEAYTRVRAAAREAENRRDFAAPRDSQGARPPPRDAGHRETQGSPPWNPGSFPELGARDAGVVTSAQTRERADTNRDRPTAELSGRAPRARGEAPPPQNAGQPEAAQAPTTESSPSPTGAPATRGRRPTSAPSPTCPGESVSPADTVTAASPDGRGFPRALRGNKPGGFPQERGTQRGGCASLSSGALPPQEDLPTAGSQGGDSELRALLEQLTRIIAALAQHLPPRALGELHRACSTVLADIAPNNLPNTNYGGQP